MYSEIKCNKNCVYQKDGNCHKVNTKVLKINTTPTNCEFYLIKDIKDSAFNSIQNYYNYQ